jgi:putative transposase
MLELPEIKDAIPEYETINSQVLQQCLDRLQKAFQSFFRRVKKCEKPGFPRFKGYGRYNSFTLKNTGWKLEDRYLWVKNVGRFKMKLSRPIQGEIKTITINRTPSGKWYASFSCGNIEPKPLSPNDRVVGIDVGIKYFLADSEGVVVDNPHYLKESERKLRVRQRRLSRRKKGSIGRKEAKVLVAKTHEHIVNQRQDFQHKKANEYIENYGTICFENLMIKNMVRNKHLAKAISDASWGRFFNMLKYKAEYAGRIAIEVPPHNSSQICSGCGQVVAKSLSVRTHICPYCGLVLDRDVNAAKNHKHRGLAILDKLVRIEPLSDNVGIGIGHA